MSAQTLGPLCDYDARIVSLLNRIDSSDINRAVDLLLRCDAASAAPITVFISCQGGDIIEGLKLADTVGLLRSPLTVVALGLVEGAALLLLASATKRVLYPSALLSTAGLWDLPHLHQDAKRGIGLHQGADGTDQLQRHITDRVNELVTISRGRVPHLLADPDANPRLFDATTAIQIGLADAIIEGPHRLLIKSRKQIQHVSTKPSPHL